MPAGDGTGPVGMGPMTGRGVGYCGGYDAPGWANWGPGRGGRRNYGRGTRWGGPGYGRGGGGWGYRHWYHATRPPFMHRWVRGPWSAGYGYPAAEAYGVPDVPLSREREIEMLKDEADWLKQQLDTINQRMDELSQE